MRQSTTGDPALPRSGFAGETQRKERSPCPVPGRRPPPPPRAVPASRPPRRRQVPRETFGMLCLRGFGLTVFCDPCKDVQFVNLVERPDLADVPVGSVAF